MITVDERKYLTSVAVAGEHMGGRGEGRGRGEDVKQLARIHFESRDSKGKAAKVEKHCFFKVPASRHEKHFERLTKNVFFIQL